MRDADDLSDLLAGAVAAGLAVEMMIGWYERHEYEIPPELEDMADAVRKAAGVIDDLYAEQAAKEA